MINHSNLTTINEIEQQAEHIISEFRQQASHLNFPPLEWSFIKEFNNPRPLHNDDNDKSIRVEEHYGALHLYIYPENLLGISHDALQGWLELKIVLAMMEADTALYQFNFQNQIRPLMRLTGGALFYIRELVEHLSRALKSYEATKIISGINRGLPQVYYYFYTFHPTAEARELYKKLKPHNWSRANHLCIKLGGYMGLSYLSDQGVGFSNNLLKEWQKKYGLTEKDQAFMDDMVFIADHYHDHDFSFRLVEMFKVLKESLLIAGSEDTAANDSGLSG